MAEAALKQTFQEESVSAGNISFGYDRQSLAPTSRDRNLPKFDYEAQRAMRDDAEVHAGVEFLVDAILEDGVNTLTAVKEDNPEFDEAQQIESFIRRNLFEKPQDPFVASLKELIRGAMYHAHKVGEIVLRLETMGEDNGRLVLDKIKPKPHRATAFVVNQFLDVLGLVGAKRGQMAVNYGSVAPENIIPKEKFLICTLEKEDSDPRGVVQVRAAFEPFCDKQITIKQFQLWRKKCAIRNWTATTPENAQRIEVRDADGTVKKNTNGTPVTISANQSVTNTLARMENDTVATFSAGTVVTPHELTGTGEQFERAFSINNREIRKAILLQTMATGENDKGGLGYGGHETGERVVTRRINSFRLHLADQISDFCTFLVELNFGADKRHLTPKIDLGDANKLDLNGRMVALSKVGFTLDKSQFEGIDADTGLPKRADGWMDNPAPVVPQETMN